MTSKFTDIETHVSAFFPITTASTNDMKDLPEIPLKKGT